MWRISWEDLVHKEIIGQGRDSKFQVHAWNALTNETDNNFAYVNKFSVGPTKFDMDLNVCVVSKTVILYQKELFCL